jgi:hypothetical protein
MSPSISNPGRAAVPTTLIVIVRVADVVFVRRPDDFARRAGTVGVDGPWDNLGPRSSILGGRATRSCTRGTGGTSAQNFWNLVDNNGIKHRD